MNRTRQAFACAALLLLFAEGFVRAQQPSGTPRRNIIIFVADGLRHGSVNEHDAPTLLSIRRQGVHFENSHSLFPTFTTANASAIATGHGLGDTGDFSNTIWTGHANFDTGNFSNMPGTPAPFIENDQTIADLDDHFHGNYLNEETLLALARKEGYNTAAIGKTGPVAVQDAPALAPVNGKFPSPPATVFLDDASGSPVGIPLPPALLAQLKKEGMPLDAPSRSNGYGPTSQYNNGYAGDASKPGTIWPNVVQQRWFVDVATRALLPMFVEDARKPFVLLFWSRDPDGTQHGQGDSLGQFDPGINGESSRAAVHNADHNLKQLLDWLHAHPKIEANTDVFVTSDHGFATVSRKEIDRTGHVTASEAAQHNYVDATGKPETPKGTLPTGFLAIDLAVGLKTNLFDSDRHAPDGSNRPYRQVRLASDAWEHPAAGNGLLGEDISRPNGSDAKAIVAANGGSDLIYVPDGQNETVQRIVNLLLTFDYVEGVFVDDKFGDIPGTLPLSAIGLVGSAVTPRPAIVVAFKVFYLNPADLQTAVQISDAGFQEGQGMHGGFGRECTFNNMAAIGPDFKKDFADPAPVSNADITPTLAHIMGIALAPKGHLQGRVLTEALAGGPKAPVVQHKQAVSAAAGQAQTLLLYQELGSERYFDAACLVTSGSSQAATACPR